MHWVCFATQPTRPMSCSSPRRTWMSAKICLPETEIPLSNFIRLHRKSDFARSVFDGLVGPPDLNQQFGACLPGGSHRFSNQPGVTVYKFDEIQRCRHC